MAFFVVQRDADSALSIPLPSAYPTREAAIAALSAATSAGTLVLTGEVFIADLGTAVPVLVMQAAPPLPTSEPSAGDSDAVASETVLPEPVADSSSLADLDEATADEVYAAPLLGDEQSLAAALKRAATSLEDEGIVAPESVAAEASDEQAASDARPWEWTNVEAYQEPEDAPADTPLEAAPEPATPAADADAETEAEAEPAHEPDLEGSLEPASAPDEPVADSGAGLAIEFQPESDLVGEQSDADASIDADELSPYVEAPMVEIASPLGVADAEAGLAAELSDLSSLDAEPLVSEGEAAPDDAPILTSAPAPGEEAYVPRPVILGDYADAVVPVLDSEREPLASEPDDADVELPVALESAEAPLSAVLADAIEGAYEATGELDLGGYTCQDCVYANTCPKVGQATPADCGSFQWRSE